MSDISVIILVKCKHCPLSRGAQCHISKIWDTEKICEAEDGKACWVRNLYLSDLLTISS